MNKRSVTYNIDPELIEALDAAVEATEIGDVPDKAVGIYSNLKMNG